MTAPSSPQHRAPAPRLSTALLTHGAQQLAQQHAVLGKVLEHNGRPPLWLRPQSFRSLVLIVLEQKVSIISARAVMTRVDALCPTLSPMAFLTVDPEDLFRAGVSRRKIEYCRGMAEALVSGQLSLTQLRRSGDESVQEALCAVRGIGPWTAGVYALMCLARPNGWASGDRALAVAFHEMFNTPDIPDYPSLDAHAERWQPWRGVAARILWHDYLIRRGQAKRGPPIVGVT